VKKILKVMRFRSNTVNTGRYYEQKAKEYLLKQVLSDFRENFHSRFGEIDLIAKDDDTLVFIEVRYRQYVDHGSALATVTRKNNKKIRMTAQHFLQKKMVLPTECRAVLMYWE